MNAPEITRKSNGWFAVEINDKDADGNSFSFSTSFQTRNQAEAFIASMGFGEYLQNSNGLPAVVSEPSIDRGLDGLMRSNRAVGM